MPGALKRQFIKRTVLAGFFLAAGIWFVYFLFGSGLLTVKTVNITGLQNIPRPEFEAIVAENLRKKHFYVFPNRNIALFSKQALRQDINKRYIVDELVIDKKLPFTLNIIIKEKQARLLMRAVTKVKIVEQRPRPAYLGGVVAGESAGGESAAACSEEGEQCEQKTLPPEPAYTVTTAYYYLDVNGIIVSREPQANEKELAGLPVVEVGFDDQTFVKPGDTILNPEQVAYVFSIYEQAKSSSGNIAVAHVIFDLKQPQEFKMATSEGWQAFFSRKLALETQFKKLELALNEKIKDRRKYLQYVDLRVKDRVYYK